MTKETGGSASPVIPPLDIDGRSASGYPEPEAGKTLRDYFAAKALQGYLANPTSFGPDVPDEDKNDPYMVASVCAIFSYMVADAMLKAR